MNKHDQEDHHRGVDGAGLGLHVLPWSLVQSHCLRLRHHGSRLHKLLSE